MIPFFSRVGPYVYCTLLLLLLYSTSTYQVPHGYTATYEGLQLARHILMDSRPKAKKAVFVLTDGKSNIGPPPVKVAFDILSLQWDRDWDETTLGPQVTTYETTQSISVS